MTKLGMTETPSRNLQDAALTCQLPDSHTRLKCCMKITWCLLFLDLVYSGVPLIFSPAMETAHPASSGAALWSGAGVCACAAHCLRCTGFSKLDVRCLHHHHIQNPIKTVAMESIGKTPHLILLCPLIVAVACGQRYGCILCLFRKENIVVLGM